jgi:hypothetical protein
METARYISDVLKNPEAVLLLIDDVEKSISERLDNPIAFKPYHSIKKRIYPYYRIYKG